MANVVDHARQSTVATVPGGEPTLHKINRYGWVPDIPDARDLMYAAALPVLSALPPVVDLRAKCPAVYDQGHLGSCTANAIGAAFEFVHAPQFMPSRLFIYYNERKIEHSIASDNGAQIRDGVKSVATQGVCPETDWPYDPAKFAVQPPAPAYADALKTKATKYLRLPQALPQLKGCLAEGFPFVFGFTAYQSFEGPDIAKTGVGKLPAATESVVGGHAVMAVGYDDAAQTFLIRNSWGEAWGVKGYFTFPYAYLLEPNLSQDFWTIRQAS